MRRAARIAAVGSIGLLAAAPASAHLMNTGFGPFYDGLLHPLVSPDDLLPAAAVALWAGLGGARAGRWVAIGLPVAWLAGLAMGRAAGAHELPAAAAAVLTILAGALVAADARASAPGIVAFAALVGVVHGWLNFAGASSSGMAVTGMLGIAGTMFFVTTVVSGAVVSLRPAWTRIAVRVAGSWIAATGLLMLGWTLRKGAP